MNVGAMFQFYLPPRQKNFSLWGTCSKNCLNAAHGSDEETDLKIFAAFAHGHQFMTDLALIKARVEVSMSTICEN